MRGISHKVGTLYRDLAATATGPGSIYLYKPLLHLFLPNAIARVVVLDTDIFLFSDLALLHGHFADFDARQLIGLAVEQCPSYNEVRALGGASFNGGVQLLALQAALMTGLVPSACSVNRKSTYVLADASCILSRVGDAAVGVLFVAAWSICRSQNADEGGWHRMAR